MGNRSKLVGDLWNSKWTLNNENEIQFFDRLSDMAQELLDDTHDMATWYKAVGMMRMAYSRGYADCAKRWREFEDEGGGSL